MIHTNKTKINFPFMGDIETTIEYNNETNEYGIHITDERVENRDIINFQLNKEHRYENLYNCGLEDYEIEQTTND